MTHPLNLLCLVALGAGLLAWAPTSRDDPPAAPGGAAPQDVPAVTPGPGEALTDIVLLRFQLREDRLLSLALSPVSTHADGLAKRFLSVSQFACADEVDDRNHSSASLLLADGAGLARSGKGDHWVDIVPREGLTWRDVRGRLDLVVSLVRKDH